MRAGDKSKDSLMCAKIRGLTIKSFWQIFAIVDDEHPHERVVAQASEQLGSDEEVPVWSAGSAKCVFSTAIN